MAPGNLNQTSHVLDQTATHLIEEYGSTLPVVVTEILTISESKIDIRLSFKSNIVKSITRYRISQLMFVESSDVTVCTSPNGWAWLVHGRRLVVWRYTKGHLLASSGRSSFASVSANCRELTLPPSDLSHNAKLVNVFAVNENQTPSCIAVSPEGKS